MVIILIQESSYIRYNFIYRINFSKGGMLLENNHENNSKEKNLNNKEESRKFIFRPWITKNGKKFYAKSYGIKAFKIYID